MPRHICTHGHFCHPPRETSWLESVDPQDGAYPRHDRSARITAECDAQDATSRVLDVDGRIVHTEDNYEHIAEDTSWSCAHRIERWRWDCGCADGGHPDGGHPDGGHPDGGHPDGGHPDWQQRWRAPLRAVLDGLRDELDPRWADAARGLIDDLRGARDASVDVILDRTRQRRAAFLETWTHGGSDDDLDATVEALDEAFSAADLPETSRRLEVAFGPDRYTLSSPFRDARTWSLELDTEGPARVLSATIERATDRTARELAGPSLCEHVGEAELGFFAAARTVVELATDLSFEVGLWRAQNLFHATVGSAYAELLAGGEADDGVAAGWIEQFRAPGDAPAVVVDP